MSSVIVWDFETVPDLKGFAAASVIPARPTTGYVPNWATRGIGWSMRSGHRTLDDDRLLFLEFSEEHSFDARARSLAFLIWAIMPLLREIVEVLEAEVAEAHRRVVST